MPRDFGLRHAGIMFKRQRGDGVAVLAVPANAGKADDGADIGARTRQRRDLLRNVEIGFLNANSHGSGHGRIAQQMDQPPVIGGKKAISRAPAIMVSGLTWAWSIAARITRGVSKAWAYVSPRSAGHRIRSPTVRTLAGGSTVSSD